MIVKPSLSMIKEKMGAGRAPSKVFTAKEIQKIINKERPAPEDRGMIIGLLWFFSGKRIEELNDDVNDLYDEKKDHRNMI